MGNFILDWKLYGKLIVENTFLYGCSGQVVVETIEPYGSCTEM